MSASDGWAQVVLAKARLQYHPQRGWVDDDGEGLGGDALGEQQRREARFLVQGLVSRLTDGIEASLRGGAQCI